jgi:hypothetical protein
LHDGPQSAQLARGSQRARIPERHLSALARDREQAAVRAVGDRADEAAQRAQAAPPAQRLGVEEVDRPVAVSECERAAVRAEREPARKLVIVVGDERPRDGERPHEAPVAREIPRERALVVAAAVQGAPVRRNVEAIHLPLGVAPERLADLAAGDVPDDQHAVGSRGHERPPVGREPHRVDEPLVAPREATNTP